MVANVLSFPLPRRELFQHLWDHMMRNAASITCLCSYLEKVVCHFASFLSLTLLLLLQFIFCVSIVGYSVV